MPLRGTVNTWHADPTEAKTINGVRHLAVDLECKEVATPSGTKDKGKSFLDKHTHRPV